MNNISTPSLTSYEATIDWIVLSLYFITAIIAIFGNIYVCLVIYYKKKLRSTTYMLVLNMAISDIIGGVVIPGQWLFCATVILDTGGFAIRICGLWKSMQILSYYVSTFTMTAIAFDRYRHICKPLSNRLRPQMLIMITWGLGLLFVLSTFFSLRIYEYFSPTQGLIVCRIVFYYRRMDFRKARVIMIIITRYIIPLSITCYLYGMVVKTVWKRERIGTVLEDKQKSFNNSKRRTIKMLILVTVLFGLAWLPVHVMQFLEFLHPMTKEKCNKSILFGYWLGITSCAYNPFIYHYFNDDFKSEARRYLNYIIPWYKLEQNVEDNKLEEYSGKNAQTSSITI